MSLLLKLLFRVLCHGKIGDRAAFVEKLEDQGRVFGAKMVKSEAVSSKRIQALLITFRPRKRINRYVDTVSITTKQVVLIDD
jgi:hypothetical protein